MTLAEQNIHNGQNVQDEQDEKYIRMTTTPVEKLVGKLAIPTIITMLVTAFYNMADTFFVGRLDNTSATGAVGVALSFMAIIQACGFFFGQGAGNTISRLLGQKKNEEATHMAAVGFFSSFLMGMLLLIFGMLFLEPLARLLGSTDTILPYSTEYLGIILVGAPFMTCSLMLNNLLRFQGNAFYSMLGIGSGALLNVALDPLFIFTLGLGVAGAAWATIISQFIGFCILLFCCSRGDNIRIRFSQFRPHAADYRAIVRGGLPTLCRQGLSSVATVCLNFTAGIFGGDPAIAAMSIATKLMMFAFSALIGFGQGFQPVCGFNYGAGLYRRVRQAFWFCVRVGTVLLILLSTLGWVFADRLVGLFSRDPAVLSIGALSLQLQCLAFPLSAFTTMCNMMTQNIGRVGRASFLSMGRQGIFFIPAIIALPRVLPLLFPACDPLLGVQLAQPLADVITFAVAIPLIIGVLRDLSQDVPVTADGTDGETHE